MASLHTTSKRAHFATVLAFVLAPIFGAGQMANGLRYLQAAKYDSAHVCFGNALLEAEANGDVAAAARAHNAIGVCQDEVGNFMESGSNWHSALSLYRATGDSSGVAKVLSNLGGSLYRQERYTESVEILKQALSNRDSITDPSGTAKTHSNIGAAQIGAGNLSGARESFEAAFRLQEAAGDSVGALFTGINLAVMYKEQGDTLRSITEFESLLPSTRSYGTTQQQINVLRNLMKLHAFTGNTERATLLLDEFYRIAQPERISELRDGLEAAEIQLDAEQTARHLERMKMADLEFNRTLLIGVVLVLILLVVFLFIARHRAIRTRAFAQMQLHGTLYDHERTGVMVRTARENVELGECEAAIDQMQALEDLFFSRSDGSLSGRLELLKKRVAPLACLVQKSNYKEGKHTASIDEVFTICENLVFHHAQYGQSRKLFLVVEVTDRVIITLRAVGGTPAPNNSKLADMAYSVAKQMGGRVKITTLSSEEEPETQTVVTF